MSNCNDCSPNFSDDTSGVGCSGCGQKCHEEVATFAEVDQFRNAFVTVTDENAVYHVDEVGNPIAVSRSPIYRNNYTPVSGAYKQLTVFDFTQNKFYVFSPTGTYKTGSLS